MGCRAAGGGVLQPVGGRPPGRNAGGTSLTANSQEAYNLG